MWMLALQNQNQMTDKQAAALALGVVGMVLILVLVGLAIAIVICLLLYTAQKRVPMEHRRIEPGLVWLLLIPIFNYVWNFFVFLKIPESYQSYFRAQGRTDVGDCGRSLGQWYAICAAVGFAGGFIPVVNCFAGLIGLASLVLLIIFLIKITGLKNQIPVM